MPELHRRAALWFARQRPPDRGDAPRGRRRGLGLLGPDLRHQGPCALLVSADRTAVERVLRRIPAERLDDGPDLQRVRGGAPVLRRSLRRHGGAPGRARRDELATLGTSESHRAPWPPACCSRRPRCGCAATSRASGVPAHDALVELSGPALVLPGAEEYRAVALDNLGVPCCGWVVSTRREQQLAEALAHGGHTAGRVPDQHAVAPRAGRPPRAAWRRREQYATEAIELVEARGWDHLPQSADGVPRAAR